MLPAVVTDAAIADELPGVIAWAERHRIELDTRHLDSRIVRVVLVQEATDETFYLQGGLAGYKAVPPAWEWQDATWSTGEGLHLSPRPRPESTPFGSSMFLPHNGRGLICAHFNRLAYGRYGGVHSDWGSEAQWTTAGQSYVRATTIGDMLQSILRDFRLTSGRMA
jgi:hypothetical protein